MSVIKKYFFCLCIVLFQSSLSLYAQTLLPVWGKQMIVNYQTGMEYGNYLFDLDKNDNIYISVSFPDQFKTDNLNLKSECKLSNIILRVNEKGKILWQKQWLKNAEKIYVDDILVVNDNLILVSGNYWGRFKVNDNITLDSFNASGSTFVICFDSSGVITWAKGFINRSGIDFFKGLYGEIYFFAKIKGSSSTYEVFDSIVASGESSFGEINTEGNLLWLQKRKYIDAIAIDKNKNIYAASVFGGFGYSGKIILDTFILNASSSDRNDIFLAKINQNGRVEWVNLIQNFTDNDPFIDSRKLCVDEQNNIYLSFQYRDSIFINKKYEKGIKSDRYFIVKFNEYGKFQWFEQSSTTFDELNERAVSLEYSGGKINARAFMHSESVFQGLTFPTINEETAIIELDTSGLAIKQTTLKIKDALYRKGKGYAYYQLGPLKRNPNLIIKGWEFKPIENDWILIKVDTLTWWTDIKNYISDKKKVIHCITLNSIYLNQGQTDNRYFSYEILDMNGKVMCSNKLQQNQSVIYIGEIPSGIYILKLFYDNEVFTEKFIKLHATLYL